MAQGPDAAAEAPGARLVPLGYVSRAHGIGGDLRVERFQPESTLLETVRAIVLRPRGQTGGGRTFTIADARPAGTAMLVHLEGVDDREAADALRAHEVLVPREALPELEEDEFYLADLIGLEAREGERVLGPVTDVVHHPASDCARVRTDAGTIEVPLLPPYLVEIDLKDGVLRLAHVEDFEPEAR